MRQEGMFTIANGQYKVIKQQMLSWANQFGICLFMDSNSYEDKYGSYECLLGVSNKSSAIKTFADIAAHHNEHRDWLFGHISYDYKNALESKLSSRHEKKLGFDELNFFCPDVVCTVNKSKTVLTIFSVTNSPGQIYEQIVNTIEETYEIPKVYFNNRTDKNAYLQNIEQLRQHIEDGDCYEINYCTEGYAENIELEPLPVFNALNKLSPAPFAVYYKHKDKYMMCASPERYLKKQADYILAQPIKGTIGRKDDATADEMNKKELSNSIKDRAENVMIVDLMRNDFARSCQVGSVVVDELFGIYTFPQVHQMISTVRGKLKDNTSITDAIKYSFPMGSMTGAPKIKVMELIDQYEDARRELFSGTVGYITPDSDFDFNVIIRSLFYNAGNQYLAYQTGGAITYDSQPEKEYEEMRLKAWAIERIFQ